MHIVDKKYCFGDNNNIMCFQGITLDEIHQDRDAFEAQRTLQKVQI